MSTYKQPYTPTHYNEYIPSLSAADFKLGLQIKQQQFDQGWKSLQDSLAKTNDIEVYRDEDKAYLNKRKDEITANINKYSNLDLGDSRNVYELSSQITPIYKDQRIIDNVGDSVKISTLQKNIADLEKNHPERYSPLNKNRDLRALQSYMSNPNSRYEGPTTPTLYTDYKKALLDIGSKLKPEIYDDPKTGQRITGVSAKRILELLPADARHQMDIDMEESGVLTKDASKVKLAYTEQNLELERYQKTLAPTHPDFLATQKIIDANNAIIHSTGNDDVIVDNYNSHQKNNFYNEYASGVAYTQAITSQEKLQQNAQDFQYLMHRETMQAKEVQNAWAMGYDIDQNGKLSPTLTPKLGGVSKKTPSGFHYLIDGYLTDLVKEGDGIDLVATGQEIPISQEGTGATLVTTKIGRIVKEKDGYTVYTHQIDSNRKEIDGSIKTLKSVSLSSLRDMYKETRKLVPEEFGQPAATPAAETPTIEEGATTNDAPSLFDSAFKQAQNPTEE